MIMSFVLEKYDVNTGNLQKYIHCPVFFIKSILICHIEFIGEIILLSMLKFRKNFSLKLD